MTPTSPRRYLNSQPGAREEYYVLRDIVRGTEDAGVLALGPLDERLEELYVRIPVDDGSGWQSTCKIIRPRNPWIKNQVLIVMFHGGGFMHGSPEVLTRPGREFALEFDAVIVSVEYRLAPEYPWPTAVLDAWAVCCYLAEAAMAGSAASIFGEKTVIDTSGLILAGISAGANIASAVLSMFLLSSDTNDVLPKHKNLKMPITGIYLGVPHLLEDEIVPSKYASLHTSRKIDVQQTAFIKDCLRIYNADMTSPLFSPINLPDRLLSRWPRTYFQVGDLDVWRDDGIVMETVLREHGVSTRLDRYPLLDHTTWNVYTAEDDMDIDSELGVNTMNAMKWLLDKT